MPGLAGAAPDARDEAPPGAVDVRFNPRFLVGQASGLDLAFLAGDRPGSEGTYRVDVFVNGSWKGRHTLEFRPGAGGDTSACLDRATLEQLGIEPPAAGADVGRQAPCQRVGEWLQGVQEAFDASTLRYELTVPNVLLSRTPRGQVSPSSWDRGINAGFVAYQLNLVDAHPRTGSGQHGRRRGFLGLRAGVNLGHWQLRHDSSMAWVGGERREWDALATYAQRPLTSWGSQLVVGDTHTSGELFDSLRYRGIGLASDDRMLPDSLRGYAPVVRGIAETRATVEIRQNGQLLHSLDVAPGAFVIDDLYPTGYGGDLEVTVIEADGRKRVSRVPYSSVNRLLRAGMSRYAVAAGQVRDPTLLDHPDMLQATYQRGIGNALTLFGGVAASDGYRSLLAGAAVMTPVGEFAVDTSHARTRLDGVRPGGRRSGSSVRLSYNNRIDATDTHIRLSAWQYPNDGYLGQFEAILARDHARRGEMIEQARPRDLLQLSVNQRLGDAGSLYLSASMQDNAGSPGRARHFLFGYGNRWGRLTYGLSASRGTTAGGAADTQYLLSMSVPLGRDGRHAALNGSLATDGRGRDQGRLGLVGTAGTDNRLRYGVTLTGSDAGGGNAMAGLQYTSAASELSASYTHGGDYRQTTLGASGSLVVHPGGVSVSPRRGDTMAIIHAPGAQGAGLQNAPGIRIGANGYAVLPHLSPYRLNTVTLDPRGMGTGVELQGSSRSLAPVAGAIASVGFQTRTGHALLVDAMPVAGTSIPFGARVLDEHGAVVGMVGQGGLAYVRAAAEAGTLVVRWGDVEEQSCRIEYRVPKADPRQPDGLPRVEGSCQ